jgi:hypothetical protein
MPNNIYQPLGKMLLHNFLGGVAWGLGTLIGVGIILAIFGFIISKIDLIPILGSWIVSISEYVLNTPTYKSRGL